jgi:hypothetical protein
MTGRVLVWDPPHTLEHEWRQRVAGDGTVRYELSRNGDATVLIFTHRGLNIRGAQGFVPGTHAYLDRPGAHLAGTPPPCLERPLPGSRAPYPR